MPVPRLGSPCLGWSSPGHTAPVPSAGAALGWGQCHGGTRECSPCCPCPSVPRSLAFPRGAGVTAGLSSVVLQTQTVQDPKAAVVQGDLLAGSRIPIPRLPAIFIPTQLTANARGFLSLRCSTQHSEMCSFTQVTAGSGVHFFVLCSRAAADGLSYSQGGQE